MSFEGYYQLICKKGHYYNTGLCGAEENTCCPYCKSYPVCWNLVDTTNDEGHPIKPKVLTKRICCKCGSILEETYKIPKKGHKP
jgi:hypothetical protein